MALDARDVEIHINSHVRYVDTGTIGKVIDEKVVNDIEWVKIDKTNMWYRANLVELLDEKDIKTSHYYDKEDDGDIDVETMKEKAMAFEDMDSISGGAEGGG